MAVKGQASATWLQAREDSITAFEAIDNALAILAKAPGTRVLLMVSSGFLSGTLDADRAGAVDRAVRAGAIGTTVAAVTFRSRQGARPHYKAAQPLEPGLAARRCR